MARVSRVRYTPSRVIATAWTLMAALAIAVLIGVRGEFPLSDDAAYAYAVHTLCTTGTLHFLPWTAASLVLQAAYGAALCRAVGFSFTVLRASTVALAIAGVIAFVQLLRHRNVRGRALAFATAVFALNPLYVNLAFTFMTDVPFTALIVWAAYGYVRGIGARRAGLLLAGAAATTAALLVRQQGILLAVAAAAAIVVAPAWRRAERVRAIGAAVLLPTIAFVVLHLWLFARGTLPIGYTSRIGQLGDVSLTSIVNCGFRGFVYLGLFLSPLLVASDVLAERRYRRLALAFGLTLAGAATVLYLREHALMFYLTNIAYDLGLGPLTLRDTLFLGYDPPLHVGPMLALPLTILAVGSAALLGAAWVRTWTRVDPEAVFLNVAAALLFAATLLQSRYYLDRHLLPIIPPLVALIATTQFRVPTRATVLLTVLLGWYAIAGTHDYLAWNRARFVGLDALLADGVSPAAIDGGVEFNAWYLSPTLGTWPSDRDVRPHQPATVRSWWWVVDDQYVASFHPLAGYAIRQQIPFTRWLVPGHGTVLILERMPRT